MDLHKNKIEVFYTFFRLRYWAGLKPIYNVIIYNFISSTSCPGDTGSSSAGQPARIDRQGTAAWPKLSACNSGTKCLEQLFVLVDDGMLGCVPVQGHLRNKSKVKNLIFWRFSKFYKKNLFWEIWNKNLILNHCYFYIVIKNKSPQKC